MFVFSTLQVKKKVAAKKGGAEENHESWKKMGGKDLKKHDGGNLRCISIPPFRPE